MLALMLKVADQLCAIPARAVIEVVPKVDLRPSPEAPPWFPGSFAYRGGILPVVDLSMRLAGSRCPSLLSSRIVVIARSSGSSEDRYGLMTEGVTDVCKLDGESARGGVESPPYVRGLLLYEGAIVHVLDVDALYPTRRASLVLYEGEP